MPLNPGQHFPVMCLTLDGRGLTHVGQAAGLCAAGARWIQLRMKGAERGAWLAEARATVAVCRPFGAVVIVNDDAEIAAESGADGVHLGSRDGDWRAARHLLGDGALIGGTVNHAADAERAAAAGCLDYVGIGPFRFTATKQNLAPVLGLDGIRALLPLLGGLPAWAIGGIEPADLPAIREAGLAGVAVSSGLGRSGRTAENLAAYLAHWETTAAPTSS
jgi:thiamine-phosphate pyrophosphorylase